MKLSSIAGVVGESPTLNLNAKTAALKKQGLPIIHLGGGEPETPAPLSAVEAIIKKVQTRKIKYSPATGGPELRKAVCGYTKSFYGFEAAVPNVIISSGAKQAIYNFLMCAVNPGDEVVYPVPYWVSYPEMVQLVGGRPVPVAPAKGIESTFEEIQKAITPKTKAVMFNNPGNPAGIVYGEDFVKKLVELCEQRGIWLMTDDIYHQLVFGGAKTPSPFKYAKNPDNIVAINGVSKVYGLTGLRIGWAVSSNKEMIAAMGRVQAQTTSCNSDVSEAGALGALTGPQDCVAELVQTLEENKNILMGEYKKIKDISVTEPKGTFYSFVDFSKYNKDSMALSEFLLEKVMVATVPGACFGLDGYLRISYCAGKENILEGMRRIIWALDKDAREPLKIGGITVQKDW
ncbi:MAG: pyridoxal phosphate-dependent aminotransferase [Elusimicrobiota bacterium]|jgi:aspartate aminotransferase|nr:pyridoxal phosphate-dependent aminotransferase [Elusimicrobiota bacterium]